MQVEKQGFLRSIRLVLLVVFTMVTAAGWWSAGAAGPGDGRPAEVLSWRHEILPPESYAGLAKEWEAYAGAHPKDPRAFVEWGDALRYSGDREGAKEKYAEAFRIDSTDAAAITAYTSHLLLCDMENADWDQAHERLLRASKLDPDYPETYYTLWLTALHRGDRTLAGECLRRLVETGDMPHALVDFGYNMIIGAPENAIILTNGDNDTYPPLACQELKHLRPDVTIVNLSLLNARWYVRYVRDSGIPIGLDDQAIKELESKKGDLISAQVQRHLFKRLSDSGRLRPLCYSVTVAEQNRILPSKLELQGLLNRIHPAPDIKECCEEEFDLATTQALLSTTYRMDSITDPFFDWTHQDAIGRLGGNYVALFIQVGEGLMAQSPPGDYEPYLYRAVQIATFHGIMKEMIDGLLEEWGKKSPSSSLYLKAKEMAQGAK